MILCRLYFLLSQSRLSEFGVFCVGGCVTQSLASAEKVMAA